MLIKETPTPLRELYTIVYVVILVMELWGVILVVQIRV